MKQLFHISTILMITGLVAAGCKKEKALEPTPGKENVFGPQTLPQGNHPYDSEIQNLYNKYNTLFLYKYQPYDLYFAFDYWRGGIYDAATDKTIGGYFDVPADEAWVGKQIDLLKDLWLHYYPDSLLRGGLPPKVFLVDSFYSAYSGTGRPSDWWLWPEAFNTYSGGDYLLASWGSSRMDAMTPQERYAFKSDLNSAFLQRARELKAIKIQPAFTALTNYSAVNSTNWKQLGLVDPSAFTPQKDLDSYLKMIVSNSYTNLTAPGGYLHSSFDVNGVIRKKYDILISYFINAFGVDLQAIGNEGA